MNLNSNALCVFFSGGRVAGAQSYCQRASRGAFTELQPPSAGVHTCRFRYNFVPQVAALMGFDCVGWEAGNAEASRGKMVW